MSSTNPIAVPAPAAPPVEQLGQGGQPTIQPAGKATITPAARPQTTDQQIEQYTKNQQSQAEGEQQYSDWLYQHAPDEYKQVKPVDYAVRKIHDTVQAAAERGIEHDPEYLKQAIKPHVDELADFMAQQYSGGAINSGGKLGNATEGALGAPIGPEGINFEELGGVERRAPSSLGRTKSKFGEAVNAAYDAEREQRSLQPQPNPEIAKIANDYNTTQGNPDIDHSPAQMTSPEERAKLADEYAAAKHNPNNPQVKQAYDAMKQETLNQFHALQNAGIKFDFTSEDPYKSAGEMMKDIRENHHLSVYTESGVPQDHPLAEVEPKTGQTYNTIFRGVHDVLGHAPGGHDFSENGEESAFKSHGQMYSPEALPAVAAETQGQSNWFFNNKGVREGAAPGEFAEQKATVLPSQQAKIQETTAKPTSQATVAAGGTGAASSEELNRPEVFVKYSPSGQPTFLGKSPDATLKLGEAILAVNPSDGKMRVQNTNGLSDEDALQKFGPHAQKNFGPKSKAADIVTQAGGTYRGTNSGGLVEITLPREMTDKLPISDRFKDFVSVTMPESQITPESVKTAMQKKFTDMGGKPIPVDMTEAYGKTGAKVGDAPAAPTTVENSDWANKATKMMDESPAGGIDPRTGASDTTGVGSEIYPEGRAAQPLDHRPTEQDLNSFYSANKDIFEKHPELRVGWDKTDKGWELNIGAAGTPEGAKILGKKLDQRAVWDIGKGEEIQTGGAGARTDFPNYSLDERINDLKGKPASDIPEFEHLSKPVYDNLEPDERGYLEGNKTLQRNVMKQYHSITPSVNETTNAMQAGAALGGWWKRYIDIFHGLAGGGEQEAKTIGPSHAEILKQWHAAVSGNKSVEDANNLAWHSYADWLDAGKPTDRKAIDDIVRKNGAQPEGSLKKGNGAISDTRTKSGKIKSEGLDTSKLFNLVNSPEMRGEKPFHGEVFNEKNPNALKNKSEGARKLPSMGATVAGEGNLNRLVIDAHMRDFYGHTATSGPAAQYIADSVHLRQAAQALGLKGGEGQEQLWGTVLGLKSLLKEGLTPAGAAGKLNSDVINKIGKDYAEVIANDPEISKPGGVLDRLKEQYGIGTGSAGVGEAYSKALSANPSPSGPGGGAEGTDTALLAKTAERIRGQISPKKLTESEPATPVEDKKIASLQQTAADAEAARVAKNKQDLADFVKRAAAKKGLSKLGEK